MSRKQSLFIWIPVVLVALATAGCPKKQPTPPQVVDSTPEPEVTQTKVVTPPPPAPMQDEKSVYEGSDFQKMTLEAHRNGALGDVYFAYDRYDLEGGARDRLAKNAEFMRAHPGLKITIEGHCDERGTNEYNLALGDRRAHGAKSYVTSLGVNGSRMNTVSYGEERSLCNSPDESCWQRNRRAAFLIVGKN